MGQFQRVVALRKESVDRNTRKTFAYVSYKPSLSARRAWIEIERLFIPSHWITSLSARRAWIEIPAGCWRDARRASLSARRAWIEILCAAILSALVCVALRKESVDRNPGTNIILSTTVLVALRKESVDRNPYIPLAKVRHCEVALRKESVDRNARPPGGTDHQ